MNCNRQVNQWSLETKKKTLLDWHSHVRVQVSKGAWKHKFKIT
jgi:hypothetical protein